LTAIFNNLTNNIAENAMTSTVEELTITYEEDGIETVKELDKQVLTKGAWSTIIYRYQDWNRSKEEYGPDKFSIRRYQKRSGEYQQKSKFNISSKDQALKMAEILREWAEKN
jgi:hypothetical protein